MAREGEEGITAAADSAIALSIAHYETIPWWFLETTASIVVDEEYVDLPSDCASTEFTVRLNATSAYLLSKRTFQQMDKWGSVSTFGSPSDYAIYGDQIRVYPIPDRSYSATVAYSKQLGPPSAGQSNAWTLDGEMLIRARAEWQLWSLRFHDVEAATVAKQVENDALKSLKRQQMQRTMTGMTVRRRI